MSNSRSIMQAGLAEIRRMVATMFHPFEQRNGNG